MQVNDRCMSSMKIIVEKIKQQQHFNKNKTEKHFPEHRNIDNLACAVYGRKIDIYI